MFSAPIFVDLHQHSLLSASRRVLRRHGITLPIAEIRCQDDITAYAKAHINRIASDIEVLHKLMLANFQSSIADNVAHIATSVDYTLTQRFQRVADFIAFLGAVRQLVEEVLAIEYDLGISRNNYVQSDAAIIHELIDSGAFAGIDLYGNELLANEHHYIPLYRHARTANMLCKAHIGEYRRAPEIVEVIKMLDLREVHHGLSVVDDPAAMREACANNIIFNVCPTSNRMLRKIEYVNHPIKRMLDGGISVTIGTDDRLLFGQSVPDEYNNLLQAGAMSRHELAAVHEFSLRYKQVRS